MRAKCHRAECSEREALRMANSGINMNGLLPMAVLLTLICLYVPTSAPASRQAGVGSSESRVPAQPDNSAPKLIQPDELARIVKASNADKPLILQVGFHVLYQQAHIPQAEYVGPTSGADGLDRLRKRVANLSRSHSIVIYCGCCPWEKCPNVNPAYQELRAMGFNDLRMLYIAKNFGDDWVDKGYPVTKGD
jgi:thiosulfate/3-mercaptopyruvate sulfurtransferase